MKLCKREYCSRFAACVFAVYCAVGLASYELYDFVDFDNWFSTKLTADLDVSHSK